MLVTILIAAGFLAFGVYVARLVVPVVVEAVVPEVVRIVTEATKAGPGA
jgi:hypothetical protein